MDKIAITSGGAGDIIISIPVMRRLGITTLYIKESFYPPGYGSMCSALKPLLELNGFTVLPTKDEGKGFDQFDPKVYYNVNMDAWRGCRGRGRDYIGQSMAAWFNAGKIDFRTPWLAVDNLPTQWTRRNYTLWFLSPRWRQSDCDWKAVYHSISGEKLFVGFADDYEAFCLLVEGSPMVAFSDNFLFTARLVRDARAVYCNQSPVLALAQGLGKEYHCAFKKLKTNCFLYTKNEYPI